MITKDNFMPIPFINRLPVGTRVHNVLVLSEPMRCGKRRKMECRCDCGKTWTIDYHSLLKGGIKSCGCHRNKNNAIRSTTHNQSNTLLYRRWEGIRSRCYRKTEPAYRYYGARGIFVAPEWHKFEPFYEWAMANGFRDDLWLERINNDGPYSPENCKWTTIQEQCDNRRNGLFLTYNGETKKVREWAKQYGMAYLCLRNRIKYLGWNAEKALTTPTRLSSRNK